MSSRPRKEGLSRWLAQGDPAAADPGLGEAEARRMRTAMLAALAVAPKRRGWLAPLLVTAAATTVLAVGWGWWLLSGSVTELAPATIARAAERPEAAPPSLETSPPTAPEPRPAVAKAAPRLAAHGTRATARKAAPTAEIRVARQLEFQTPGGTRVVWVLDPNFTLATKEAKSR